MRVTFYEIEKSYKYFLILFLNLLSSISICLKPCVIDEYSSSYLLGKFIELFDEGLRQDIGIATYIFFLVFLFNIYTKKISNTSVIPKCVAIFFTIFTLLGKSYSEFNSWEYLFHDPTQFLFILLIGIGFIWFYHMILKLVYYILDSNRLIQNPNKLSGHFCRHNFFLIFTIIFCCWLPYLFVFYPGSVPYDGYYQLNMFYGINVPSSHHPWFSTLCIGFLTMIGRNINDNFGIFCYILSQTLFCAFAFAIVCHKIFTYPISKWIKIGGVLYYAFLPVWASYAQTLMKDVIYYGLFSLFGVIYIENIERNGDIKKAKYLLFILLGCLLSEYRNEGVYIIVASIILLIFVIPRENKRKILLTGCIVVTFHILLSGFIFPSMGVEKGSAREILSIPFQQTARYISTYENELTEEEIHAIDKVLNYDAIKENYNPINSDPVKNTYRAPSINEFLDYIKVWLKQFLKHPGCYIQATINNSFGYFYPGYIQNSISNMQFYIKGEPLATGDFDIHYVNNEMLRDYFMNYSLLWFKIPGLSLLLYPGTYTWLFIIGVSALLRHKKYKECFSAFPVLFTIAICIISPVNGYLRYALPVMAYMPIFLTFVVISIGNKQSKE